MCELVATSPEAARALLRELAQHLGEAAGSNERNEMETMMDETFRCPIHGEVEGVIPMDGPLSNAVPVPLLCELCPGETVVGYDEDGAS